MVNGLEINEPIRHAPNNGEICWIANSTKESDLLYFDGNNSRHREFLANGILHLTKDDAINHIVAMLIPSRAT